MAKVIAPFKLSGTIDEINFIVTTEGNIAQMKNPIYDRIRQHGKEMGYCAQKSKIFRQSLVQWFQKLKDMSFAGRVNKILLEVLEEDHINPKGHRTLEEGVKLPFLNEIFIGFEGNKKKPLSKVLLTSFQHLTEANSIQITDFIPKIHLE